MKRVVLFEEGGTLPDDLYRRLSPDEERQFRAWAREHYRAGARPDPEWHPVVRDEWAKIQAKE